MVRPRVRIRFRKQGALRFVGHRDLVRSLERLFRRAAVKLAMSEGFHPKPRMSFPTALAVGIEGLNEIMELELAEPIEAEELLARLAGQRLPGLDFVSAETLPPGARKAQVACLVYEAPLPDDRSPQAARSIAAFLASPSCPVWRPRQSQAFDIRPLVEELALRDGVLRMRLVPGPQASAGPRDVLGALGLADLEHSGAVLKRTAVEVQP
jgi:radical SAM-linked protein